MIDSIPVARVGQSAVQSMRYWACSWVASLFCAMLINMTAAELTTYEVVCPKGHAVSVPRADASIYSDSNECDLCGSHGKVELSFSCPECDAAMKKGCSYYTINLYDW